MRRKLLWTGLSTALAAAVTMATRHGRPAEDTERRRGQSGHHLDPRPSEGKGGGPSPFVVVGAMAAAGVLVAKILDWRGHAHPRS